MPNYEEIIEQSQENIKTLSEKLKEIDRLYKDINILTKTAKEIPGIFNDKFEEIIKLTENYTNSLGISTKKYLDGNNTLFVSNLTDLQKEVSRLKRIDLEKHFDKLQKELSQILGAIISINLTLTDLTRNLTSITQSVSNIETLINNYSVEVVGLIDRHSKQTITYLIGQNKEAKTNTKLITNKIQALEKQNIIHKKGIKNNRIYQFIGIGVIIIILVYISVILSFK